MAELIGEDYTAQTCEHTPDGVRYTLSFLVETDEGERANDAILATGVPGIGDEFPNDENALCISRSADVHQQKELGAGVWKVTCQYSTIPDEVQQAGSPYYPDVPASYSFQSAQASEAVLYYHNGSTNVALVNSAGSFFRNITKNFGIGRIEIRVQLAPGTGPTAASYVNKVNSGTYYGNPAGTCKCVGINREGPNTQNDDVYDVYTIVVDVDYRGLGSLVVADAGLSEKKSGKLEPITENGRAITEAHPLKTSGSDVVAMTPAEIASGINYKTFSNFYPSTSFAGLEF